MTLKRPGNHWVSVADEEPPIGVARVQFCGLITTTDGAQQRFMGDGFRHLSGTYFTTSAVSAEYTRDQVMFWRWLPEEEWPSELMDEKFIPAKPSASVEAPPSVLYPTLEQVSSPDTQPRPPEQDPHSAAADTPVAPSQAAD